MSLQFADKLMCRSVVDAPGAVGRGRQQVLTCEVKADIQHFIIMTRQCSQTSACIRQITRRDQRFLAIFLRISYIVK